MSRDRVKIPPVLSRDRGEMLTCFIPLTAVLQALRVLKNKALGLVALAEEYQAARMSA